MGTDIIGRTDSCSSKGGGSTVLVSNLSNSSKSSGWEWRETSGGVGSVSEEAQGLGWSVTASISSFGRV